MPGQIAKYTQAALGDRLHQGEILSDLVRVRQSLDTLGAENVRVDETTYPFVVVLSQDCDLAQDGDARQLELQAAQNPALLENEEFRKRHASTAKYKIDSVLFCEAVPTAQLKASAAQQKELWKRVTQNLDPRFQCLELVPAEHDLAAEGIACLGCDFKRFFTVPTDEVYKRLELNLTKRRTRLVTPYAEHLLHRFCDFQARIPLPENHQVPL